jgi:mono/diheme cytochrome c family protein
MNKKLVFLFNLMMLILIYSCKNKSKPQSVYMPDMYYSQGYEPYSDYKKNEPYIENKGDQIELFKKEKTTSLAPVKGTVSRNSYGILPYEFSNSNEGYEESKKNHPPKSLELDKKDLERGKEMYAIYCALCHGVGGAGDGILVQNGEILGVPNYKDREITIGSIYHVIMYGKNSMGSYASALNEVDRWKVAGYVMKLKEQK